MMIPPCGDSHRRRAVHLLGRPQLLLTPATCITKGSVHGSCSKGDPRVGDLLFDVGGIHSRILQAIRSSPFCQPTERDRATGAAHMS